MKKIIAAFTALLSAGLLFAEIDNQKGLLNDQSDYINVNKWQNVNPDNLFLNANLGNTGTLSLGASKNFDKFYFATSYSGNLWKGVTDTTTTSDSTSEKKDFTGNNNEVEVLFGFGNWGIKPYFTYTSSYSSSSDVITANDGTKSGTIINKDSFKYGVSIGYNINSFVIFADFYGYTSMNKKTDYDAGTVTDNSYTYLSPDFALHYVIENSNVKQTIGGFTNFGKRIYVDKNNDYLPITLNLNYKVEANPIKNMYLSAFAYLNNTFTKTVTSSTTTTDYNFKISHYVTFYANYKINPKVAVFLTWSNYFPSLIWDDSNNGTTETKKFTTGSYSNSLSSGFGYFFNDNVALNISLDIFASNETSVLSILQNSITVSMAVKY